MAAMNVKDRLKQGISTSQDDDNKKQTALNRTQDGRSALATCRPID